MSDKMRWRYGGTNLVVAAVDSATVIEIGDFVYQDTDDAKPASEMAAQSSGLEATHRLFVDSFLGVAMQRSQSGDTDPIRVATTGVFEFECALQTFELGDLTGLITNDTGRLQDQAVGRASASQYAVARVAKREATPATSVLVDIRSTVMPGGVEGTSPT